MLAADKTEMVGHVKLSGAEEQRSGFRADIEGLRALAILLVVAVHAKFQASAAALSAWMSFS